MGTLNGDKGNGVYFVFRRLAETDEFEDTFRLRYCLYRRSGLGALVHETEPGLDFDSWDFRAHHFGLFRVHEGRELPVGYLRAVEDRDLAAENGVQGLVARFPSLGRLRTARPKHPFPLQSYHPQSPAIRRHYRSIQRRNERLLEACRLALDPCFRSLRLAQHVIESALAVYFFHQGFEHAMWCCDSSHARFHGLYGLRRLPGARDSDFLKIGRPSCCLIGAAAEVPRRMVFRLERMAETYGRTGRIACYPTEPLRFAEKASGSCRQAPVLVMAG